MAKRTFLFFIGALLLSAVSCTKMEKYETKQLTYSINYDEPTIMRYTFSGTENATAKVFFKEKAGWKYYCLEVAPDGKNFSLMVRSSSYEISILSIENINFEK